MTKTRRVKLAHVALAANVSPSTASDALRGVGRMTPETRARVVAAAKQLGYRPDATARSLRLGSLRMVGLVTDIPHPIGTPDSPRLYWPRLLAAFTETLSESGIGVSLFGDTEPGQLDRLPVDALVFISVVPGRRVPDSILARLPVLEVNLPDSVRDEPEIAVGMRQVSTTAMDHLVEQGSEYPVAVARGEIPPAFDSFLEGYRQWCDSRARDPEVLTLGDRPDEALRRAVSRGVDGLFAIMGDAPPVLQDMEVAGLRVPGDMMLVAVSEGALEQHLDPPVTTVSMDGDHAGRQLADAVLELVAHGRTPALVPQWQLVPRESTERRRG